jgi:hypothetical protein
MVPDPAGSSVTESTAKCAPAAEYAMTIKGEAALSPAVAQWSQSQ